MFEVGWTAARKASCAVGCDKAGRSRLGLVADLALMFDTTVGLLALLAVFVGAGLIVCFARFCALGARRARADLTVDLDRLFPGGLAFLAFLTVFLEASLTFCAGRLARFGTLSVAPLFARRLIVRALGAVFECSRCFFSCASIFRSFFSSFLRLFSSFVLFLSFLLSRVLDAMASSRPS